MLPACAGVALLLLTMCCSPPVDGAFPCGPAVPALIFGEGPLVGWVSTTCCSLTGEEVEVLAAFATGGSRRATSFSTLVCVHTESRILRVVYSCTDLSFQSVSTAVYGPSVWLLLALKRFTVLIISWHYK